MAIKRNTAIHALLRAACLEPLTTGELLDRAERHSLIPVTQNAAINHMRALTTQGFLLRGARQDQQRTYTLTRLGEEELDRLEAL